MEFRELSAFVAVAEEGGMSAASRRLHVSQPALSQTMNSLERELGVKLLVRSSTGVQPTEAGMAFLAEARALLARRDQALATMAELTVDSGAMHWTGRENADSFLTEGVTLFTNEIHPTDDGYDFGELKDMLDWRDEQR
jgi:molybdenum-dependent DNA-binding transcriptional regulator ModE